MAKKRRRPQAPEDMSPAQVGGAIAVSALEAAVISLVLLAILALIFSLTSLSETYRAYFAGAVAIVSLLISTFRIGRRHQSRGLLLGGSAGVLFVLLLMLTATFLPIQFSPGIQVITKIFLGFVFGALGGILGVNL